MAKNSLSHQDRSALLASLCQLKADAEAEEAMLHRFMPLARHARALQAQTMVIRGERGAGKTALFRFLAEMGKHPKKLAELFPASHLPNADWITGFSELGTKHPSPGVLEQYVGKSTDEENRTFWMAHLACSLHAENLVDSAPPPEIWTPWQKERSKPEIWSGLAYQHLGDLTQWLDNAEARLVAEDRTIFISYDSLDRIGPRATQAKATKSLLGLWLSLSNRYKHLRAKVFVREDLFETSQQAFADASKLRARSVLLDWDVDALYLLVIRQMANLTPQLREWLVRIRIDLAQDPVLGWMPDPEQDSSKRLVDRLVGERMGPGAKKAYAHRWIPNRLQDAHLRIVPRSMLNLFAYAAEKQSASEAKYLRVLTPKSLEGALRETSVSRAAELQEEHKVVERLKALKNLTVMLESSEVRKRLAKVNVADGFGEDGRAAMEELLLLGVLKKRTDGRIDVPDIYRYGYGIKRKGGVASPR